MTQDERFQELMKRIENDEKGVLSIIIVNNGDPYVLLVNAGTAEFACCIAKREQAFDKFITGKYMVSSGPLGIMTIGVKNADDVINSAK